MDVPLLLPAIALLGVVVLEWRELRGAAWVALAAAFVLLAAGFRWPDAGVDRIGDIAAGWFVPVLLVARCAAAACILFAVVRRVAGAGAFR